MKPLLNAVIFLVFLFFASNLSGQTIKFKRADLTVAEPYDKKAASTKELEHTIRLDIDMQSLTSTLTLNVRIESGSTYPTGKASLVNSTITSTDENIKIKIETDEWSSEDRYLLLTIYWDQSGVMSSFKDTLFIKNVYPALAVMPIDYTEWNDGKRAEVFLGTNFDFIDSKVNLSDWYGGARVFLPGISDLRYKPGKSPRNPRFGLYGGIYHAKSLSNFGNLRSDSITTNVYGIVINDLGH